MDVSSDTNSLMLYMIYDMIYDMITLQPSGQTDGNTHTRTQNEGHTIDTAPLTQPKDT